MKKILIDGQYSENIRVAIVNENNILEELFCNKTYNNDTKNIKLGRIQGNIYLARIKSIKKSLQAVFIDYGEESFGFLPFNHIHPNYYINNKNKKSSNFDSDNLDNIASLFNFKELDILNITKEDSLNIEDKENTEIETKNEALQPLSSTKQDLITNASIDNQGQSELSQNNLLSVSEVSELEAILDPIINKNDSNEKIEIHNLLKREQLILVQAYKEPKGQKAYMFSTYIALIGRYIVLLPNQKNQMGVSRKIAPNKERNRIKKIVNDIISPNIETSGLIARTGSLNKTIADIKNDYNYCARLWNKILSTASANIANAPLFLYKEEDIITRIMRDFLDHRIKKIIIQGEELYKEAMGFAKNIAAHEIKKIFKHQDPEPIFIKYNIEPQIINLYKPYVYLESGAYLVINVTEALCAIDVNSGKSNSDHNLAESSFKINTEAAVAITREIKLRNISGIIVIDFIDMQDAKHQKTIEAIIKKEFSLDKAKTQIGEINQFGLLELSRQRTSISFLELHSKQCNTCNGRGLLRESSSDAFLLIRMLENEIITSEKNANHFKIISNENRIYNFFNRLKFFITKLEKKYNIVIELIVDNLMIGEVFAIEKSYTEKIIEKTALIDTQNLKNENIKYTNKIGALNNNIFDDHDTQTNMNFKNSNEFEVNNLNNELPNKIKSNDINTNSLNTNSTKNTNTSLYADKEKIVKKVFNFSEFSNTKKSEDETINQEKSNLLSNILKTIKIKFQQGIALIKNFW